MKKIICVLLSSCFCLLVSGQSVLENKTSLGIYVGEGSGIFCQVKLNNTLGIEMGCSLDGLFIEDNFVKKYPHRSIQEYNNVYSTSVFLYWNNGLLNFKKWSYYVGMGVQYRMSPNFSYLLNLPPGVISNNDPKTIFLNNIGGISLIGLYYDISQNTSTFINAGAYLEFHDVPMWTKFQFRFGLRYKFGKKRDLHY